MYSSLSYSILLTYLYTTLNLSCTIYTYYILLYYTGKVLRTHPQVINLYTRIDQATATLIHTIHTHFPFPLNREISYDYFENTITIKKDPKDIFSSTSSNSDSEGTISKRSRSKSTVSSTAHNSELEKIYKTISHIKYRRATRSNKRGSGGGSGSGGSKGENKVRYTTDEVEAAVNEYLDAVESAPEVVKGVLQV